MLLVAVLLCAAGWVAVQVAGRLRPDSPQTVLTATRVRAERRAYDGAPPVIPHDPLGAACTICHTTVGKEVPGQGFAPANPHASTTVSGRTENCRQCHVFATTDQVFVDTEFQGMPQVVGHGDRLFPGAPPVIPHALAMRENCLACHAGPAARPEIRCTHPLRRNCGQCHVARQPDVAERWPFDDHPSKSNPNPSTSKPPATAGPSLENKESTR